MAAARAARDAARLELERANVRARVELAVTREVLRAAWERSRRYETELLPKAQSVRQSVAAAFSDGATSLLALLEAERNANEVSAQAAGARADLLAARADFEAAQDRVPQLEKQP